MGRILGPTKIENQPIIDQLLDIIERYDLCLLQEIKDQSQFAPNSLFQQLNERVDENNQYLMLLGPRVGRTSQATEQYAYVYKERLFTALNSFSYEDVADNFNRDPYVAHFQLKSSGVTFAAIGLHTPPSDAFIELSALPDAQIDVSQILNEQNIVMFGDFNADQPVLSLTNQDQLQIFNDPDTYVSLISRNVDTTTAESASDPTAYDRIVITKAFEPFVVQDSATAFNFAAAFGLSAADAFDVSDHYPVEFHISNPNSGEQWSEIYSKNFDGVIGAEWSSSLVTTDSGHTFLGRFGEDQSVQVIVPANLLPGNSNNFRVRFLFHAIGNWNGRAPAGPDTFTIEAGGVQIYKGIFCNSQAAGSTERQSYPTEQFPDNTNRCGSGSISYDLSYSQYFTYQMEFEFSYSEPSDLTIRFAGELLATSGFEPISSESWGIDDVSLEYLVPPPSMSRSPTASQSVVPSRAPTTSSSLSAQISPSVSSAPTGSRSPQRSASVSATRSPVPSQTGSRAPQSSASVSASRTPGPSQTGSRTPEPDCNGCLTQEELVRSDSEPVVVQVGNAEVEAPPGSVNQGDTIVVSYVPQGELEQPQGNIQSDILIVNLFDSNGLPKQPQGNIEICMRATSGSDVSDLCLAFVNDRGDWECQDFTLSVDPQDSGRYCGFTNHFTLFGLLKVDSPSNSFTSTTDFTSSSSTLGTFSPTSFTNTFDFSDSSSAATPVAKLSIFIVILFFILLILNI